MVYPNVYLCAGRIDEYMFSRVDTEARHQLTNPVTDETEFPTENITVAACFHAKVGIFLEAARGERCYSDVWRMTLPTDVRINKALSCLILVILHLLRTI